MSSPLSLRKLLPVLLLVRGFPDTPLDPTAAGVYVPGVVVKVGCYNVPEGQVRLLDIWSCLLIAPCSSSSRKVLSHPPASIWHSWLVASLVAESGLLAGCGWQCQLFTGSSWFHKPLSNQCQLSLRGARRSNRHDSNQQFPHMLLCRHSREQGAVSWKGATLTCM